MIPAPQPISLGVRSNPGRTDAESITRLINCYAVEAGEEGRMRFPVYASDGFEAFGADFSGSGTGAPRGFIKLSETALYAISGTRVVKVNASGTKTLIAGKTSTVTITIANPGVVTWAAHGLAEGAGVSFTTTGTLPTGIVAGTTYYVRNPATNTFQLSATPTGAVIQTTTSQSGTHTAATTSTISASGIVTLARNRKTPNADIAIVTSDGHFYILSNDVLIDYTGAITQLAAPGALLNVTALDGYFVFMFDNGEFYISAIDNGASIDDLDFAKAESNPDGGVRSMIRGRDLVHFGTASTEFWNNTGATDFPFERAGASDFGCFASATAVNVVHAKDGAGILDTIAFAASNSEGAYIGICILDGYSGIKISPPALDRAIIAETNKASLKALMWSNGERTFYAISGSTFTWVYDLSTGNWHERQSNALSFWRIAYAIQFADKVIVGDYTLSKIYSMRSGLYDASNDCVLTMKHSNDNGNSWLVTRTRTISQASNKEQRIKYNRCGQSKEDGKTFQFSLSYAVIEDGTAVSMTIQPPAVHAWPFRVRFYAVHVDAVPGVSRAATAKGILGVAMSTKQLGAA
jgi:hypothetical protein